MSEDFSRTHGKHRHGAGCGHTAISHHGHVDFLNEQGFLEHAEKNGTVTLHVIEIGYENPESCQAHIQSTDHRHGPHCGHQKIVHGDHVDYLVNGRLEHQHESHIDDHGPILIVPLE